MKIVIDGYTLDKDQLLRLINSGNKLVAIKMIKELTDLDLKTCKDIADNLSVNPNHYDLVDDKVNADYMSFVEDHVTPPKPPPPPSYSETSPPPPPQKERYSSSTTEVYSKKKSNTYSKSGSRNIQKRTKQRGYLKDETNARYNRIIIFAIIACIGFVIYFFATK